MQAATTCALNSTPWARRRRRPAPTSLGIVCTCPPRRKWTRGSYKPPPVARCRAKTHTIGTRESGRTVSNFGGIARRATALISPPRAMSPKGSCTAGRSTQVAWSARSARRHQRFVPRGRSAVLGQKVMADVLPGVSSAALAGARGHSRASRLTRCRRYRKPIEIQGIAAITISAMNSAPRLGQMRPMAWSGATLPIAHAA